VHLFAFWLLQGLRQMLSHCSDAIVTHQTTKHTFCMLRIVTVC